MSYSPSSTEDPILDIGDQRENIDLMIDYKMFDYGFDNIDS